MHPFLSSSLPFSFSAPASFTVHPPPQLSIPFPSFNALIRCVELASLQYKELPLLHELQLKASTHSGGVRTLTYPPSFATFHLLCSCAGWRLGWLPTKPKAEKVC